MTILFIINIISVILCTLGALCIAHKSKAGFVIYFGVELCMMYIGYSTQQYGLIVMAVIYFVMNIYSYLKWSRG